MLYMPSSELTRCQSVARRLPSRRVASREIGVRRNLRQEQRESTNRLLRQAATEVFAERGYAATTIDDIVARAGISRATFYLHFSDKESVLAALMSEALTVIPDYYADLDDALASRRREDLRSWIRRAIGWYQEYGVIFAIAEDVLAREPANDLLQLKLPDLMPKYSERWKGRLAEAHFRVVLTVASLSRAHLALRTTQSTVGSLDEDEMLDIVTNIFEAGVQPPRR